MRGSVDLADQDHGLAEFERGYRCPLDQCRDVGDSPVHRRPAGRYAPHASRRSLTMGKNRPSIATYHERYRRLARRGRDTVDWPDQEKGHHEQDKTLACELCSAWEESQQERSRNANRSRDEQREQPVDKRNPQSRKSPESSPHQHCLAKPATTKNKMSHAT